MKYLTFFCIITFFTSAYAQNRHLKTDLLQAPNPETAYAPLTRHMPPALQKPKRVAIAFLASAVIPGAGQAYNRQFVKSGAFFGAEITSIILQQKWQQAGDQQYDLVKQTAHQGWSIIRYAEWLNKFSGYAGPKIPISSAIRQIDLTNPAKWTDAERQTVRELFNAVRVAEDQSKNPKTGAAFSHKIPFFGEQQYYELVGKYYQYSPGWPDYNGADDPDEKVEGVYVNASAQFLAYAQSHGDSQAQLRKASRISTLIVLNHFISAFEAGISARLHNRKISTTPVAMLTESGEWVPAFTMSFQW